MTDRVLFVGRERRLRRHFYRKRPIFFRFIILPLCSTGVRVKQNDLFCVGQKRGTQLLSSISSIRENRRPVTCLEREE